MKIIIEIHENESGMVEITAMGAGFNDGTEKEKDVVVRIGEILRTSIPAVAAQVGAVPLDPSAKPENS